MFVGENRQKVGYTAAAVRVSAAEVIDETDKLVTTGKQSMVVERQRFVDGFGSRIGDIENT